MKQIIITSAIVIVLLLATSGIVVGRNLLQKSEDAEKLDYEFTGATAPDLTVGRVLDIIRGKDNSPVLVEVKENIINPTDSTFTIDNIKNLRILTPKSESVVIEQKGKLKKPLTITPQSEKNELNLKFHIQPKKLKLLVNENGGGEMIAANRLVSKQFGITFLLRGRITVYGYEIDLNEKITI